MKNKNIKGFTLIEVLVVVVIIGILTSVALPQYQKSVLKSRFAQAKTIARSIADAEEVYYAAHNNYTVNLDALDISLPITGSIYYDPAGTYIQIPFSWGRCDIVVDSGDNRTQCMISQNERNYLMYLIGFSDSTSYRDKTACIFYGNGAKPTASDMTYQICKAETKANSDNPFGGYSRLMYYQ